MGQGRRGDNASPTDIGWMIVSAESSSLASSQGLRPCGQRSPQFSFSKSCASKTWVPRTCFSVFQNMSDPKSVVNGNQSPAAHILIPSLVTGALGSNPVTQILCHQDSDGTSWDGGNDNTLHDPCHSTPLSTGASAQPVGSHLPEAGGLHRCPRYPWNRTPKTTNENDKGLGQDWGLGL